MADYAKLLPQLLEQEERLQFSKFNSDDALKLGLKLIEKAKAYPKPVVVDITVTGHELFHFSMTGTSPDNNEWVRKKNNAVMRFRHSSYYLGQSLASQGKTLEEKYLVSEQDYVVHGGAFPLIIKGVGIIGTVTVSGLAQQDDHAVAVQAIEEFLASQ
ncbi:hypothetical protein Unana1_07935 [Umbelopsis nana]